MNCFWVGFIVHSAFVTDVPVEHSHEIKSGRNFSVLSASVKEDEENVAKQVKSTDSDWLFCVVCSYSHVSIHLVPFLSVLSVASTDQVWC